MICICCCKGWVGYCLNKYTLLSEEEAKRDDDIILQDKTNDNDYVFYIRKREPLPQNSSLAKNTWCDNQHAF